MPYGTINNVLRIKTTTIYSDSDPQQTFPDNDYNDILYTWYHPATKSYILSFSEFTIVNFSQTTYSGFYLDQTQVGVEELLAAAIDLKMYPNPTRDQLNVSFDLPNRSDVQVQITDMTGRVVMDIPANSFGMGYNVETVDVSALQTGMYLVTIMVDDRRVTKMINRL